jgi:protein-S-isoprenylcysteine O-methyltransferase Ste14
MLFYKEVLIAPDFRWFGYRRGDVMEETNTDQRGGNASIEKKGWKRRARGIATGIVFVAVMWILLFVPAGSVDWPAAWILLGVYCASIVIHNLVISPDLIEERSRRHNDTRSWDRFLVAIISLAGLAILVVAGLDYRFSWTGPIPLFVQVPGLLLVILSTALVVWAAATNPFFSSVVRIQDDRGHVVVSSGPYRYIRHPGYAGWIVYVLSLPMLLGSIFALVPAVLGAGLDILRTLLEDRTLQAELAGYGDYVGRVRYRLLPGVW